MVRAFCADENDARVINRVKANNLDFIFVNLVYANIDNLSEEKFKTLLAIKKKYRLCAGDRVLGCGF